MHNAPASQGKLRISGEAYVTADQRLIRRIEEVEEAVADDRLLAAYHMLEEILRELDVPVTVRTADPRLRSRRNGPPTPTPLAAAG